MKPSERGTALLTVLLLVAVMAVVAAASLEKLRLATRLSGNSFAIDQARAYAGAAETIAVRRAQSLMARSPQRTVDIGGWNGRAVPIPLPQGTASVRVSDGGNCFNLNSVVAGTDQFQLTLNPRGMQQFAALMRALEIPATTADRIAAATVDWIDSDIAPMPNGGEDEVYVGKQPARRPANILLTDPSELRGVEGVTPELYRRLRPWICTLPSPQLSPININTLKPEQAPLLVMLFPAGLTLDRARSYLAGRPPTGYGSAQEFLAGPALAGFGSGPEVQQQVGVRTEWLALETRVDLSGTRVTQRALVDARQMPLTIVQRLQGGE